MYDLVYVCVSAMHSKTWLNHHKQEVLSTNPGMREAFVTGS